jgi:hypothetical protein
MQPRHLSAAALVSRPGSGRAIPDQRSQVRNDQYQGAKPNNAEEPTPKLPAPPWGAEFDCLVADLGRCEFMHLADVDVVLIERCKRRSGNFPLPLGPPSSSPCPAASSDHKPRHVDGALTGNDTFGCRGHEPGVYEPCDSRIGEAVCKQERLGIAVG